MKRIHAFILLLFLLISFTTPAYAIEEGHLPLLALLNKDGQKSGLIAGLDLKIIEGTEKVYLQTFPMTQISTQVSMRFAQQIACDQFELDCSKKDFLYAITATPGIIGGPSAGAAATILTASVLMNKTLAKDTAITGTINSGGLIGPVGGVEKKIEAAAKNGIKKVLIPFGTKEIIMSNNMTLDLIRYGKELNISIEEVKTIDEAANKMAGIPLKKKAKILKIDQKYLDKMKAVSDKLCNRTEVLTEKYGKEIDTGNFTERSKKAFEEGDYYSSASYCFRTNLLLRKKAFENITKEELKSVQIKLEFLLKKLREKTINKKIRTITDIETYMAVMERTKEAEELLETSTKEDDEGIRADILALATERIYSARVWAQFFDLTYDTRIVVDEKKIKRSCLSKISEAEERINYVRFSFDNIEVSQLKKSLEKAYRSMEEGDNIMCLYNAAKVKSEADLILALRGISDKTFNQTMQLKLDAVKDAITKSFYSGTFPIISYSYYEYAQNLFESEEPIAALFAEYALELASIDLYFKEDYGSKVKVIKPEKNTKQEIKEKQYVEKAVSTGILITMIILAVIFYEIISRKREKKVQKLIRKQKKQMKKK